MPGEKELVMMKKALKINDNENLSKKFSIFKESGNASRYISKMDKYFKREKNKQFKNINNRKCLINGLEKEFSRILLGEIYRTGVSLKIDAEYDEAIKILSNRKLYDSILSVQDSDSLDY